jgi:hypothetical protein
MIQIRWKLELGVRSAHKKDQLHVKLKKSVQVRILNFYSVCVSSYNKHSLTSHLYGLERQLCRLVIIA